MLWKRTEKTDGVSRTQTRTSGLSASDSEHAAGAAEAARAHLTTAADLIRQTGYHRRDAELQELLRQAEA